MNDYPIVFVHGLMGWGRGEGLGLRYFGWAEVGVALGRVRKLDIGLRRRALFPSVGPISSHHDRACELFYRLKGGDVRYGDEHARAHGHEKTIPGWARPALYPQWDAEHPVHLVGHSQGAPTIRKLQELLARGDFFYDTESKKPFATNADWVRSITSISGVLNGSLATYVLGCSLRDGLVQPFSAAEYACRAIVDLASKRSFAWDSVRRYVYDVDLEAWRVRPDKLDLSGFLRGKDNAAYDLSVHASQRLNDTLKENPGTYYLSYVTRQSKKTRPHGHHVPSPRMNPFMQPIAKEIGRFSAKLQGLAAPITDNSLWWENDGLVSTYAQDVPRGKLAHPRRERKEDVPLEPGAWYVMETLDMDHVDIVTLPEATQIPQQVLFYENLYRVLSELE